MYTYVSGSIESTSKFDAHNVVILQLTLDIITYYTLFI